MKCRGALAHGFPFCGSIATFATYAPDRLALTSADVQILGESWGMCSKACNTCTSHGAAAYWRLVQLLHHEM